MSPAVVAGQADHAIISALKQRMLARAAPRLAHDLNNDLTIIAGQAELARRQGDSRLQERMEQISLAAQQARERNDLIQQLADDEAGERWAEDSQANAIPEGILAGRDISADVQRLAALLAHRDLAFAASADTDLPNVDRTRLRWITGAVLTAVPASETGARRSITMSLGRGGGGLRLECHVEGGAAADWLTPTLACCATAADVSAKENGWQALILLAEAL